MENELYCFCQAMIYQKVRMSPLVTRHIVPAQFSYNSSQMHVNASLSASLSVKMLNLKKILFLPDDLIFKALCASDFECAII